MRSTAKKYKVLIILTAVLLFFLGTSYGAWTDMLHIKGIVTTSSFNIEFGNKKDIKIRLVKRDNNNEITVLDENIEFTAAEIDNKDINLTIELDKDLMNALSIPGYMLCAEYPIKASGHSKVKAINSEEADFSKPYTVIKAVPEHVEIVIDGEELNIKEEINKNDYAIDFNVYRRIVTDDDGNTTADVFIEGSNIDNPGTLALGSVEYLSLENSSGYADISFGNPVIDAQLKAKYSLKISIPAEQFN